MLNVWTRLIVSLSQFSSKITRKSLYSSKRPWQGLLMQLFTLKFWFLNLKKILSKTNDRSLEHTHFYCRSQNWHWSHGNTLNIVSLQSSTVTTVLSQRPNSNERPRAEQARPGPASGGHWTLFSSWHRLSELWTPTETKSVLLRKIYQEILLEVGMFSHSAPLVSCRHCGVASI